MEKIIKVTIPEVPAIPSREVDDTLYGCDICSHESKQKSSFTHCTLCGRLICRNYKTCIVNDRDDWGDYPAYYCKICADLKWDKYAAEYSAIYDEKCAKEEVLENKIKLESLNTKCDTEEKK